MTNLWELLCLSKKSSDKTLHSQERSLRQQSQVMNFLCRDHKGCSLYLFNKVSIRISCTFKTASLACILNSLKMERVSLFILIQGKISRENLSRLSSHIEAYSLSFTLKNKYFRESSSLLNL